ncbi:MAG: helix-turn-helix transcriptional regulator [Bacilli bacterium]|nr:helix-turn-helix transcriptional regulator [Bacilli bacterium]
MESLNERIKQLRKEKGLTQTQLADLLGVTDKAVSKWEVGEANPDISLLTKLSEIFGVSIDYLLTGVSHEKEVVIISPKEMLFKTDDPKYLEQISENDLNIVEMYEHKLVNVFTFLLDNNKIRSYIRGKRGRLGNTDDYIPEILYLCLISNRLEQLKVFNFNDIGFADEKEWTKEMTQEFVSGEKVNEKTREYVLSIHRRELISVNQGYAKNNDTYHKYGNWQIIYPLLIGGAAEAKNWDLMKKMLDIFLSINEPASQQFEEVKGVGYGDGNNYFLSFKPRNYSQVDKYIVVIEIPNSVLDILLKEHQYELLDLANKINGSVGKYTVSKKTIDLAKLESDTSLSDDEKFEQKCVYKGIINTNLLSSSNDLKLIRKILDNNYYHYFEMVYDFVAKGKNKELFEFFVDNNYEDLARITFDNSDEAKQRLLARAFNHLAVGSRFEEHEDLLKNQNTLNLEETEWKIRQRNSGQKTFRSECIKQYGSLEKAAGMLVDNPIIQHIKGLKENVYNSVISRQEAIKEKEREAKEREKMAKGLTKPCFEKLLNSGTAENIKLFKLELCSLLDAIFIYDYHYEGEDFSERMNAHFKQLEAGLPQERQMDDGWGYMVPDTKYTEEVVEPERQRVAHLRDIFYRLRVLRNNILHPEKVKVEELSENELRECLEYVFAINKKVEE